MIYDCWRCRASPPRGLRNVVASLPRLQWRAVTESLADVGGLRGPMQQGRRMWWYVSEGREMDGGSTARDGAGRCWMVREKGWWFAGVDVGHPSKAKHGQQLLTFGACAALESLILNFTNQNFWQPVSLANSWRRDFDIRHIERMA